MNKQKQESIARVMSLAAGLAGVICVLFLLVDYLQSSRIATIEKSQVKAFEEQVKTDAQVSPVLTAERERQTQISLARDTVNKAAGWFLLGAAAAFVSGMKWLNALGEEPEPPLEKIVELRAIPATAAKATAAATRSVESEQAPEIDLSFVDNIVESEGRSREEAIPILRAIQLHYGYLPDEALKRVCELTEITPAQVAGTSSFYAQFRRSPVGKHIVKICHGTACHVSGIVQIAEELHRYLAIPPDADTDPQRLFTLDRVACLGCCSLAPVMMIDEHTVGKLSPATACEALLAVEE